MPWWWNGSTFTKGSYTSLFRYSARTRKLRRLTALNVNVSAPELSPDRKSVFYLASPVRPRLRMMGETRLCRMDLAGEKEIVLAADREDFSLFDCTPGEHFAVVQARPDGRPDGAAHPRL